MDAQGTQANAREDTVFLCITTVTEDLSQLQTNLTASASGGYEEDSARVSLTVQRSLYVRWTATAAEASIGLLVHGAQDHSTQSFSIGTDPAGKVAMFIGGVAICTAAATVEAHEYSISWTMRPNPSTTGASDARISECLIYDHTDGELDEIIQLTHGEPPTDPVWDFTVGGWWNGAAIAFAPTNAPSKARVSRAFHPHTEVLEELILARTAYAGDADDGIAEPLGPMPIASQVGDAGLFAGRHPLGYAAAHARAVRTRPHTNLVNEVYPDAATLLATAAPASWVYSLDGHALMTQWVRWVPVPAGATHAWVRVHLRSYVAAGAAVPVSVRVFSFNRSPTAEVIGGVEAPALRTSFAEAEVTADHAAGGAWLELGAVPLQVFGGDVPGFFGTTLLCLGYVVDPDGASMNDANARLEINAWHARPTFRAFAGGIEL